MRIVATILLFSIAIPANAEVPLPIYDVEKDCAASGFGRDSCVRFAQDQYERAKLLWPQVSDEGRNWCIGTYRDQKDRFRWYKYLVGCLEVRAMQERASRPTPRFRP